MEAVRRYVFPIIWMVIIGLMTLALVKIAFFSGDPTASAEDGATPQAAVDQYATVPVSRGDIASTLELTATVEADEGTALKAKDAGEITEVSVSNGDRVEEGTTILKLRVPQEAATAPAVDPADPNAVAAAAPAEPQYKHLTLKATTAGVVRDLDALKGQTLAIGDIVATISPGTYAIVAPLTPEQQLQLLDQDLRASAVIPGTEGPVACEAPKVEENSPDASGASNTGASDPAAAMEGDPMAGADTSAASGGASSAASLRCPVLAGTKIVPGLGVDVTVDLGTATGVLTVPTTAVKGEAGAGTVYVLDDATGEPTEIPVTLGKKGEDAVEITGGLEEGQEVLQYVPGVDAEDQMGMETW